jgi:hypothetical protein
MQKGGQDMSNFAVLHDVNCNFVAKVRIKTKPFGAYPPLVEFRGYFYKQDPCSHDNYNEVEVVSIDEVEEVSPNYREISG